MKKAHGCRTKFKFAGKLLRLDAKVHGQDLLHKLFHWKFCITDRSAKTVKLFHLERFDIFVYQISNNTTVFEGLGKSGTGTGTGTGIFRVKAGWGPGLSSRDRDLDVGQ